MKFKNGEIVKLPLDETGKIISGNEYLWMNVYKVKIRKATFNKTNQVIEFLEKHINEL